MFDRLKDWRRAATAEFCLLSPNPGSFQHKKAWLKPDLSPSVVRLTVDHYDI